MVVVVVGGVLHLLCSSDKSPVPFRVEKKKGGGGVGTHREELEFLKKNGGVVGISCS